MRILVVEDTQDLSDALCSHLRAGDHTVDHAATMAHAQQYLDFNHQVYDVVILDIELPDGEGTTVLRQIRQLDLRIGVLVLTARSEIDDKVHLLDVGADDYLTKPFVLAELDARIRSVHRRHLSRSVKTRPVGRLAFDPMQRTLWDGEIQIMLRTQELKLFESLWAAPGGFLDRSTLLNRMYEMDQDASDNALEVHVSRLRKRLEPFDIYIKTIRGQGYQLVGRGDAE
jgi:two-component system, OmpR family, response regulator TctD